MTLTADGCVDVLTIDDPSCCPPPLCGNDLCCTFVAFFNLLPSGPMWDYWKAAAISYFQYDEAMPEECPLLNDPACPSVILHAIYTVLKLKMMVHDALWPAFRESNPNTAITTLDAHLARLQWEDCYHQHCRSVLLGEITPYEIWTECGPMYCETKFPEELECALKRNIAIALTRANMGVIKNLCNINWVIEPLGAEVRPVYTTPPVIDSPCDPDLCTGMEFTISQTQDWMYGCGTGDVCDVNTLQPKVSAMFDRGCDLPAGLPSVIWPGVLAAECIVRSLMPLNCPSNITRICPELPEPPEVDDPFWIYVVLLLGFEGPDGSGASGIGGDPGFTDESLKLHGTGDSSNASEIDTSQFKFGTASAWINGFSPAVIYEPTEDWCLSSANSDEFTVELWVRFNTISGNRSVHVMVSSGFIGVSWYLGVYNPATTGTAPGEVVFGFHALGDTSKFVTTGTESGIGNVAALLTGIWYHIACDKDSSGKIRIYVNGVPKGSSTPVNSAFQPDSTIGPITPHDELDLGAAGLFGGNGMDGWLDEVRITKGIARYKTDIGFTPPNTVFQRGTPVMKVKQ